MEGQEFESESFVRQSDYLLMQMLDIVHHSDASESESEIRQPNASFTKEGITSYSVKNLSQSNGKEIESANSSSQSQKEVFFNIQPKKHNFSNETVPTLPRDEQIVTEFLINQRKYSQMPLENTMKIPDFPQAQNKIQNRQTLDPSDSVSSSGRRLKESNSSANLKVDKLKPYSAQNLNFSNKMSKTGLLSARQSNKSNQQQIASFKPPTSARLDSQGRSTFNQNNSSANKSQLSSAQKSNGKSKQSLPSQAIIQVQPNKFMPKNNPSQSYIIDQKQSNTSLKSEMLFNYKSKAPEPDWKDIQPFLDKWGLQLKPKNAYTKSEVIEFTNQVQQKMLDADQLINYERQKSLEYKEESRLLNEQIEKQKEKMDSIMAEIKDFKKLFNSQKDLVEKLQECQTALKESLMNSVSCIEFYKDIEAFIQENKYDSQSEEVVKQLDIIEQLALQHGMDFMEFDTDKTQKLVESIGELLRLKEIEKRFVSVDLNDEAFTSDDELRQTQTNGVRKVKVCKVKRKRDLSQVGLHESGERMQSSGRDNAQNASHGQSKVANRHLYCCQGNAFALKQELHHKSLMVFKLKEQLESRIKKILELKMELRRERDEESNRRKQELFKDTISKLEKEYNEQVIRTTKLSLENKTLKEEIEEVRQHVAQLREKLKNAQGEIQEFKKVLQGKEGFQTLENTVIELTNLLVSKKNTSLNTSQKNQLKAIFGNSVLLHQLRQRLQQIENYSAKQSELLTKSMRLNLEFQDIIEDQWSILKQSYLYIREVDEKDLQHYQLILMHKQLIDKCSDEAIDQYERNFASKLVILKELKNELQNEDLAEEMSKQMAEDKDKINLLQMMMDQNKKKRSNQAISGSMTPMRENYRFDAFTCRSQMKQYAEIDRTGNHLMKAKQMQRIGSENFLSGVRQPFPIDSKQHSKEEANLLHDSKLDEDFQKMFEFQKHVTKTATKNDNYLKLRVIGDNNEEEQVQSYRIPEEELSKLELRKVQSQSANPKKLQRFLNTQQIASSENQGINIQNEAKKHDEKALNEELDKISIQGLSQLDESNLYTNPLNTDRSISRGLNGKKLLRMKLKRIRDENQKLKQTLKIMQEKLQIQQYANHVLEEGDISSLHSHYGSLQKILPQLNQFNLMNDISSSVIAGGANQTGNYISQTQGGMNQNIKDPISITQGDALNIILMQAQAVEELIAGTE